MKIIHIHALGPNPGVGSIFICQFNGVVCFIVLLSATGCSKNHAKLSFCRRGKEKIRFLDKKTDKRLLVSIFPLTL